jgi:hypothetical protein
MSRRFGWMNRRGLLARTGPLPAGLCRPTRQPRAGERRPITGNGRRGDQWIFGSPSSAK